METIPRAFVERGLPEGGPGHRRERQGEPRMLQRAEKESHQSETILHLVTDAEKFWIFRHTHAKISWGQSSSRQPCSVNDSARLPGLPGSQGRGRGSRSGGGEAISAPFPRTEDSARLHVPQPPGTGGRAAGISWEVSPSLGRGPPPAKSGTCSGSSPLVY